MTPSEIAERLGHAEVYEIDDNNHALGNLLLDAAATIRELEAVNDIYRRAWCDEALKNNNLDVQLKIATEALEMAAPSLARVHREHIATQALARIKEVG